LSRDVRLYLEDIHTACLKVLRYTSGMSLDMLLQDDRTFDAVIRNLAIVGEAIRGIPDEFRRQYPEVEWRKIAGFRDVAIHAYPTIDEEIVWDIIQHKVPTLLEQVEGIIEAEFP
jgi:uncharacterized protein with HEPN domain